MIFRTLSPTRMALAAALCLGASLPVAAVPVPIDDGQPDTVLDVYAGDVRWKRPGNAPTGGGGAIAGPSGQVSGEYYRVLDAEVGVPGSGNLRGDPYDRHLSIAVNDKPFLQTSGVVDRVATATGTQLNTITRVLTGGITTSLDYYFNSSNNAARAFGRFTNDTGSAQTVRVLFGGELGSDASTTIEATSSGDKQLQAADDIWLINSDNGASTDPVQVFSFAAQGAQMPDFSVWGNYTGAQWTFSLAAGETRNLMWFSQMHFSLASAQAAVGTFSNLGTLQAAGLLEGLSSTDLAQTLNWTAAPVPEPSTWALVAVGLLAMHQQLKRRRRAALQG